MGKKPSSLGKVIESMITTLGHKQKFHGWRIVNLWPQIVGPELAKFSRAVRFSEGILTVVAEKDVWRQELEMQLEQILNKVRSFPEGRSVNKIVLKGGHSTGSNNE